MKQAVASARQAVASASSAQASASRARAAEIQAGKDAAAAATAASQARSIEAAKRRAEAAAAAKAAAEAARKHQDSGTTPVKQNEDTDGDTKWFGMWPEDMSDPKDWADATGHWSTVAGGISVGLGVVGIFFPPAWAAAGVVGLVSLGLQGVSTVFKGFGYGWGSAEFQEALGITLIGGIFFGKGKLFEKTGVTKYVGAKVSEIAGNVTTTVIGWLDW